MNLFYTDGQAFENKKPIRAYMAVVQERHMSKLDGRPDRECDIALFEEETLISFLPIGEKIAHEAEGLALLQALRYIEQHKLLFSTIITDSLVWSGYANEVTPVRGSKDRHVYTRNIAAEVIRLKKLYFVSIIWKKRSYNKAGRFLSSVWNKPQSFRDNLEMVVDTWSDVIYEKVEKVK